MFKIYSIMAAAALIAGALGDRLDMEARLACRQQSWPYLDRSCIRDVRTESGSGRTVRIVSADRK
jgi:hypothetical protein